jgi:sigma-B regulation protein RsbU (phosphoserine phosphatase)
MFASASYVVADVARGELRYANAGHPEPVCVRHESEQKVSATPLHNGKRGPVLGIFEDAQYSTAQSSVSIDDIVLLFTDGLFEVESDTGALYDEALLIQAINRHGNLSAPKLVSEVLAEVQQFAADQHFSDDVCLIAMEIARLGPLRLP